MRRRLLALSLLALPLLAACTGKDAPAISAAGSQTSASATGSDSPSATSTDSATGTATDSATATGTGTATDSPTGVPSSGAGATSTEAPSPSPSVKPLRYFFSIQNGQILGPVKISMHVGQTVELRFATDRNATIHAHGFDVTKQLTAGVTDSMFVTATAPGSYNVEDHSTSKQVSRIVVS